jgi:3-deoxy-D-manno-octulosonic-acid transferase/heptosyltransferase-1
MIPPSLSVAILTRNRLSYLKKAVESLLRQQPPPNEILIIDTGSTDDTRDWIREMAAKAQAGNLHLRDPLDPMDPSDPPPPPVSFPRIRLLEDTGEGSFAGARNRAVAASRGDWIAFLDDDCEADDHWTRRIHDRLLADPELDVLGGVTLPAERLDVPDDWPPEINWVVGLSVPGCWGPDAGTVHLGQTSNLAFRRRAWESVPFPAVDREGFDAGGAVYDAGREDVDWWRRLRRLGWRAELDGRLLAWHHIPQERFDWRVAMDRARRDGKSHWRRAGTPEEARSASSDIVHSPVRVAQDVARKGTTPRQALRHVRLWSARQAGLLEAAVADWNNPIHPQRRAGYFVGESVRMAAGVAKWGARRVAHRLHRALRHTRPLPSPQSPPRALLLVSCGFLGDQLLIQPALRLLRSSFPETRIVLLTGGFGDELYGPEAPDSDRALVDRVIDADAWRSLPLHRRHARLVELLRDLDPAAAPIFYAHKLWPAPLFLSASPVALGFDRDSGYAQQLWYDLQSVSLPKDFSIHEILNHVRLARCLAAEGEVEPFTVSIPEDIEKRTDERLDELNLRAADAGPTSGKRPFLAVHPGVGLRYKEWPAARWLKLVRWIERETPYDVVFIGGRDVRPLVERFQARGAVGHNLCGRLSLRATAVLLRKARLLITTDSGPKHLAMAVRAPTLTLYGPSDERRWGAFRDSHLHHEIRAGLSDLTPEDLRGLPPDWTLRLLTVEDVTDTLADILD